MIEGYEWVLLYSPNRFFLPDNHLFFIEDIKVFLFLSFNSLIIFN